MSAQAGQGMRRVALLGIVVLAFGVALAACGGSSSSGSASASGGSSSGGPVKVGYIQALTGPGNVFAADNNNGLNAALAQINAHPPGGHKIVLVRADDATDPTTAAQQCSRLVNQDHVVAVIGQEIAAAVAACNQYAAKAGIPYIENAPGAGTYCAANYYNVGPTNQQSANTLIDFLMSKGYKRIYFVGSDAAAPKLTFQIAEKYLASKGGTVAGTSYEPLNTSDWSSDLSKIASSHPDAIFSAAIGADDVAFHKQLASNPQTAKIKEADLILLPVLVPVIGPQNLAGSYLEASYLPTITSPASQTFVNAVKSSTGGKALPFQDAAFLYYSTHLLDQAIAKAGGNVSGKSLQAALKGESYTGPAGTWSFASNQLMTMPVYIGQVSPTGQVNVVKTTTPLPPGSCS
jgi:ABC-type branched-subunit amino acid transport system substrate-binding protein